jgi:uncharacterized protein YjiS (DUF1127 family)
MAGLIRQCEKEIEMTIGHIWYIANPELRDHLRQANEERAAAFYAAFTALGRAIAAPVEWLLKGLRSTDRKRATYQALSRLSDHQLQDIGVWRSEIASVAEAVAKQPPEVEVTLADLRNIRSGQPVDGGGAARPVVQLDEQRSRATERPARRAAARLHTGQAA